MEDNEDFVDLYALLQVRSTCDNTMLDKAFRHFAQQYHPDHSETADIDKFQQVLDAYRLLKDPESRAAYDTEYNSHYKNEENDYPKFYDQLVDSTTANADAEAHEEVLFSLYKRRRERADDPGVMRYYIQQKLQCTDESFEFHIWYLKSKGFIELMEDSSLAITIAGVDHVIANSREKEAVRLLTANPQIDAS